MLYTLTQLHTAVAAVLAAVAPRVDAAERAAWADALVPNMNSSGIATPHRVAMLLGQCAEETGGWTVFEEDLDYLSPARIHATWPTHFPSVMSAAPYVRQPEKLANLVYANRMGNGPPETGDGWLFRGRSPIQQTGRAAYTALGEAVGMSAEGCAAWIATKEGGARSACWCWTRLGCNPLADAWSVRGVSGLLNTGRANGPTINLPAREAACAAALRAIS